MFVSDVQALDRKGVVVDDITLEYCVDKIPDLWPNTLGPISSVRLLRPWNPDWPRVWRFRAIDEIVNYITENGMKVLLTTHIGCIEAVDDKHLGPDEESWEWTKDLLRRLTPSHVMGVAIGNEMDQYYRLVARGCAQKVWDKGGFWRAFTKRVQDLDDMGFMDVPITVVLSANSIHDGHPFVDKPGQALVNTFLKNATAKYGTRFVFTFNLDPYHDPSLRLDEGSSDQCTGALEKALCWDPGCSVTDTMTQIRQRITYLTGSPDYRFWVGEVGWASENSSHLHSEMQHCTNFSSNQSLQTFYSNFLAWDFTIEGVQPPDHVFYKGLRDSPLLGEMTHFGLITTCEAEPCKIFAKNIMQATVYYGTDLSWLPWMFAVIGFIICCATLCTTIYVSARRVVGISKTESDLPSPNLSDSWSSSEEG